MMTKTYFNAVASASIETGPVPFNVYTKDFHNRLILFCRSGYKITTSRKKTLKESARVFYLSTEDMESYYEYSFERLERIVSNPDIRTSDKTQIIHGIGKRLAKQLMSEPRSGKVVKRSKKFVTSHLNLIISSPEAAPHLFALSTYDSYTYSHSINVCTFCLLLGKKILGADQEQLKQLGLAGLLHDIGKTQVNQRLLFKPSSLNEIEMAEMRRHAVFSYELLLQHHLSEQIIATGRSHHERLDGSGYPDGLMSDDIHPFAKITAVADVYDALTSNRVYKKHMPHIKALKAMTIDVNLFDHDAFETLIETVLQNETLVTRFRTEFLERHRAKNLTA